MKINVQCFYHLSKKCLVLAFDSTTVFTFGINGVFKQDPYILAIRRYDEFIPIELPNIETSEMDKFHHWLTEHAPGLLVWDCYFLELLGFIREVLNRFSHHQHYQLTNATFAFLKTTITGDMHTQLWSNLPERVVGKLMSYPNVGGLGYPHILARQTSSPFESEPFERCLVRPLNNGKVEYLSLRQAYAESRYGLTPHYINHFDGGLLDKSVMPSHDGGVCGGYGWSHYMSLEEADLVHLRNLLDSGAYSADETTQQFNQLIPMNIAKDLDNASAYRPFREGFNNL